MNRKNLIEPPSYHVYPIGDYRDHDFNKDCWCKPSVSYENDIAIYTHNSMDKRELYETGELLHH